MIQYYVIKVILWDIDGTLIKVDPYLKSSKHIQAINEVMKVNINHTQYHYGMTDLELIHFYSNMHAIKLSSLDKILVLRKLDQLTKIDESRLRILPGIYDILKKVDSKKVKNGIITGNTRHRAYIKLKGTDLINMFDRKFVFYGGHLSSRKKLVQNIKCKLPSAKFIVVGDSLKDIEAAKNSEVRIVSVATGGFSIEELSKLKPDLVISNFESDGDKFLDYIDTLNI